MSGGASPFRGRLGIARAGYGQILVALSVATVGGFATGLIHPLAALPWIALPAFVIWFFRDPERRVARGDGVVLAPADGTVDDLIELEHCALLGGPAVRIGIYLSLFSVHVQRAPFDAVVVESFARAGRRVPTHRIGELDGNEQYVTILRSLDRAEVLGAVRQIAGPIARGIVNVLRPGELIVAGARFGLIRFGSRVELFLPAAAGLRLSVVRGARVRAGETVLAVLGSVANKPDTPASVLSRSP